MIFTWVVRWSLLLEPVYADKQIVFRHVKIKMVKHQMSITSELEPKSMQHCPICSIVCMSFNSDHDFKFVHLL